MRYLPVFAVSIWCLVFSGFIGSIRPVLSVENPQSESPTVSATVPERNDPDIPTLVSPANQSTIGTTAPTFIFEPSLGATVVTHYQLWLDGQKNTDHIPASTITITTNALAALAEGQHSWFIKAIGPVSLTRDSAIWTFTVDTTPPLIIIESVAGQETSLSSANLEAFSGGVSFNTSDTTPTFIGQGESGASLTISLTGTITSTNLDTIVEVNGDFSLTPSRPLPSGTYTVSVSSTDAVGNTTTLPSFILVITPAATGIIIPLPSPLPDLTFDLPFSIASLIPQLPTALVAIPISPEAVITSYLPWIIILLLLIHIAQLLRLMRLKPACGCLLINTYQKVSLYITLWLPFLLLIAVSLATLHWIPSVISLLMLVVVVAEHRFFRT